MYQIFWEKAITEECFLVVPDGQTHSIAEFDSCLHFVFYTDDVLLELDIWYDICGGFQGFEHEDSGIKQELERVDEEYDIFLPFDISEYGDAQ